MKPVGALQGELSPFDESVEELYDHAPCGYVTSGAMLEIDAQLTRLEQEKYHVLSK